MRQARAIRRCGELLKQIPRGDEATRFGHDGTVMPVNRTSAATQAGLSERQKVTALRVANVPPPALTMRRWRCGWKPTLKYSPPWNCFPTRPRAQTASQFAIAAAVTRGTPCNG